MYACADLCFWVFGSEVKELDERKTACRHEVDERLGRFLSKIFYSLLKRKNSHPSSYHSVVSGPLISFFFSFSVYYQPYFLGLLQSLFRYFSHYSHLIICSYSSLNALGGCTPPLPSLSSLCEPTILTPYLNHSFYFDLLLILSSFNSFIHEFSQVV
jgi:hypothetical protein